MSIHLAACFRTLFENFENIAAKPTQRNSPCAGPAIGRTQVRPDAGRPRPEAPALTNRQAAANTAACCIIRQEQMLQSGFPDDSNVPPLEIQAPIAP